MIGRITLGVASALALATAAHAADIFGGPAGLKDGPVWVAGDILNSNNQITVQFVTTDFNYKEYGDGTRVPLGPLDAENHWVPGFGVSLSLMRNWIVDNLYLNAQYSHLNGPTDYTGSLIGGKFGSLLTKDGAVVDDLDFRLGKGFELRPNLMATPFLGIGWHNWDRKVNQGEDYSNGYVGAGLLVQWSPLSRLVLSIDGLAGSTFDSHIYVAGPRGFSGALGDSFYYKAGLSADYALTQAWHVSAGVEWYGFKYGESAILGAGGYFEPNSQTYNTTVKVGIGYAFGADYAPLK